LTELFAGDSVAIQEMVTDFINQQQLPPQMEKSLGAKNYLKFAGLAHHNRSSLSAVGLEALRKPLENLDITVQGEADPVAIQRAYQMVVPIHHQAVNELHSTLKRP
jgi:HPt (histidine-containing phosphotransfer) domain-containing protein